MALLRALLLLTLVAGCGSNASPIALLVSATQTDDGTVRTLEPNGTADRAASEFPDGLLLLTRWATNREGVSTVELIIDVDRRADDPPRYPAELTMVVRQRDADGGVVLDHTPLQETAMLHIDARSEEGRRDVTRGSFAMDLPPADGALYSRIVGSWGPGKDDVITGDSKQVGDAKVGPGDTNTDPGDTNTGPGDTNTGDDRISVGDSRTEDRGSVHIGCACPGGIEEEELPDEEGDDDETGSTGCDCSGEEDPESAGDNDSGGCQGEEDPDSTGDDNTGGGCQGEDDPDSTGDDDTGGGCQGDDSDDDTTETETETETTDTDSDSGNGCDCKGEEPDPEPEPEVIGQMTRMPTTTASVATVSCTPKSLKKKKRRKRTCNRSRWRVAMEMSPFVLAYVVTRRQRRPSKKKAQ